ncbi:MAG: TerB family tellurite resistance protein [Muribaculaceae bacterium]|nr:TerB family tellurite resistance protein [Muribaculaceae bacterium]
MANKVELGQIKNLIMLAMADGKASESELALIASIASREQLTQEELDNLIENPDGVEIEIPEDEVTRKRYLCDMVALMMIDGEMDDNEIVLCQLYATALGYPAHTVEHLVLDISNFLTK